MFSENLIQRTGIGAASDIFWKVIFRSDGDFDPLLSTMDSQFNLVRKIPAKKSIVLTGNIYFFQL